MRKKGYETDKDIQIACKILKAHQGNRIVLQIHFWYSKVKCFKVLRNTKWPLVFGSSIALPAFSTEWALKTWKGKKKKKEHVKVERRGGGGGSNSSCAVLAFSLKYSHSMYSSQLTVSSHLQQLDKQQHNLTRSSRDVSLKEI